MTFPIKLTINQQIQNLVCVTQGIKTLEMYTDFSSRGFLTQKGTRQIFVRFKASLLLINQSTIGLSSLSIIRDKLSVFLS